MFLRLSEILEEASQLLKILAEKDSTGPMYEEVDCAVPELSAVNGTTTPNPEHSLEIGEYSQSHPTIQLLQEKGVTIKSVGSAFTEAEGLLKLAGIMGQKHATIKPFIDQIKRAQSSRRRIVMDLSKQSQESISDITLVADLTNKAGLLPNYRYSKSPLYRLSSDAPVSPIAINFFTGQWLEFFALKVIRNVELQCEVNLWPLSQVHVLLPNGDQFELDLVFTVNGKLVWVEAKTTDDFERLLPKYKAISELICESSAHAILLWLNYIGDNVLLSTRGAIARMTLCGLDEFSNYVNKLVTQEKRSTIA